MNTSKSLLIKARVKLGKRKPLEPETGEWTIYE